MKFSTVTLAFMCVKIYEEDKQRKSRKNHSRYMKQFFNSLEMEERRIRQRSIPRVSLLAQHQSAWHRLYKSESDQALITLTGLDFQSFHLLCCEFAPIFDNFSPFGEESGKLVQLQYSTGRPRKISAQDCLGLVLAWTRTRGSLMALQLIFGMTMTNVSMYIRFGRRVIIEVLKKNDLASIRMPTELEIQSYMTSIASKHPNLKGVWATMDGLKIYLQQSPCVKNQEHFYNGWTHDHYVTNVLVFCPDGTIPMTFYNCPGSVHDSQVAMWGNIYEKLEMVYEKYGAKCTADSAFKSVNAPYLIKSSQDPLAASGDTREEVMEQIRIQLEATSMRQAAEWGMHSFQSSFPRIKDRLVYEERGERKVIIKMMLLLYNYRARMVGINQIKNVYMPHLGRDGNCFVDQN